MIKGFSYTTINLKDDYEGNVIATLISSEENTNNRPSVLYLHGFTDYFFHPHLANKFIEEKYDFYALELRKYGDSLLPHQRPNYCRDIKEYFEELDFAIRHIFTKSNLHIILLGHSTGGLLASLYMNIGNEKSHVNKLILNSPFFDFNIQPKMAKHFGKLIAGPIAKLFPYASINNAVNSIYPKSLHKDYSGEWDFDLKYKPIEGFPAYYSWIHAIDKAQKELKKNSDIKVPILLIHSDKSFIAKEENEDAQIADIVLNIKDMLSIKLCNENLMNTEKIKDAKHDVFLSRNKSREMAFKTMFGWLKSK